MRRLVILLIACCSGCSSIDVQDKDFKFRRVSAGTMLKADSIEYEVSTNGVRIIRLKKASSDQVSALEKVAEGAARGAVGRPK